MLLSARQALTGCQGQRASNTARKEPSSTHSREQRALPTLQTSSVESTCTNAFINCISALRPRAAWWLGESAELLQSSRIHGGGSERVPCCPPQLLCPRQPSAAWYEPRSGSPVALVAGCAASAGPLPTAPSPPSPPAAKGALFTRCHHGYVSGSLLPASLRGAACGRVSPGAGRTLGLAPAPCPPPCSGGGRKLRPPPAPQHAACRPSASQPAGPEHGLEGEVGDPGCARTRVRREPQSPRAWGPAGAQARSKLVGREGGGSLIRGARVLGLQMDGSQDGCGSPQPPWGQAVGRGPYEHAVPCRAPPRPGELGGSQHARGTGRGEVSPGTSPGHRGWVGEARGSWGSPGRRAPRPLPSPRAVPAA